MLKIGITGGMGSGKSCVCRLFALYGVPVYISDLRSAALVNEDAALARSIVGLLGEGAYGYGVMDRAWVASRVFADVALLRAFEGLVHPAVARDFEAWAARQQAPYLLMESAILFESGFDRLVDRSVAVAAPIGLRVRRVLERSPQLTREQVLERMARQMDDDERARRSDFEIVNDGSRSLVEQVGKLHAQFLGERNTENGC